MTQRSTFQIEKILTHIYVRDAQTGFVRPCWATDTEVYCGMCRGVRFSRWSAPSARPASAPWSAF
jgi:hypothetical protein